MHTQVNQVLPIGGPGKALTAREQAEMLFRLSGQPPNFFPVPVALMDGIIGILDFFARFLPAQFEVRQARTQHARMRARVHAQEHL